MLFKLFNKSDPDINDAFQTETQDFIPAYLELIPIGIESI